MPTPNELGQAKEKAAPQPLQRIFRRRTQTQRPPFEQGLQRKEIAVQHEGRAGGRVFFEPGKPVGKDDAGAARLPRKQHAQKQALREGVPTLRIVPKSQPKSRRSRHRLRDGAGPGRAHREPGLIEGVSKQSRLPLGVGDVFQKIQLTGHFFEWRRLPGFEVSIPEHQRVIGGGQGVVRPAMGHSSLAQRHPFGIENQPAFVSLYLAEKQMPPGRLLKVQGVQIEGMKGLLPVPAQASDGRPLGKEGVEQGIRSPQEAQSGGIAEVGGRASAGVHGLGEGSFS